MLTWCVSTVLLIGAQDGAKLQPPPSAKSDGTAQLKERMKKVGSATTYSYESTTEQEGGGFGGGGGRGDGGGAGGTGGAGGAGAGGAPGGGAGRGPRPPETTSGSVEIGKAAEVHQGETHAYRIGGKLVYKKGDAWELYTPPDFSGGAAGGGAPPAGGGAPPRGGGAVAGGGPGGGRGNFREGLTLMSINAATLPHDLIANMDAKLKDVQMSSADGKTTFTGTLNDAAAEEISGAKRAKEMAQRFGGGDVQITSAGTATLVFDAEGNAEKVIFDTKYTSQRGETKRKQTIAFKDWNKAKVEIPKDVAAKATG